MDTQAQPVHNNLRPKLDLESYYNGVLAGDRAILGRAITLIESTRPEHRSQAASLLDKIMPHTGKAYRVGISGVPGVGKSTFIEAFGLLLAEEDHQVAVLAVDPSSTLSGGSILGDKTRMTRLSNHPRAFVRPSPNAGALGGVAARTREAMLLCEAAGYGIVLVETVGVGQAEIHVAEMTDFFLVLMLPGAGDELQGIKRGILEMADLIAVNKAEGENRSKAKRAVRDYRTALRFLTPRSTHWQPRVTACSALAEEGLAEIWQTIRDHHTALSEAGQLATRRRAQLRGWMWSQIEEALKTRLRENDAVRAIIDKTEVDLLTGKIAPAGGAQQILAAFFDNLTANKE